MVRLTVCILGLGLATALPAAEPTRNPASAPATPSPEQLRNDLSGTIDAERESLSRRLQACLKIKFIAEEKGDQQTVKRCEELEKEILSLQDEKYLQHQALAQDIKVAEAKLLKQKQEEDARLAERKERGRPNQPPRR